MTRRRSKYAVTRRSKCAQFNKDLPYDIMLDIITRLPFESIMALNCVSKQWKHAISVSIRFVIDKIVTFPAGDTFNCLFLTTDDDSRHHPPFTVCRIPPPEPPKQHLKTKRVYDGMACYYQFGRRSASKFVFYNLLTGDSHTIRNAPLLKYACSDGEEEDDSTWPWNCYGFGYDPYDEDYKMMVVCNYSYDDDFGSFWVYSFKKGSWVQFSGFPFDHYDWRTNLPMACAFNGKLYWFVYAYVDEEKEKKKMKILSYDLHTCGFREMDAPDVERIEKRNLMELGGRLCYWNSYKMEIDVWVMNEESSWTKLLNMKIMMVEPQYQSMEPVTMYRFRNGRELMLFVCPSNGSLVWYDVKDREVVKVVHQSTWLSTRVVGLTQPKPSY